MSGESNVGGRGVYEAGDQRTVPNSEIQEAKKEARYHEGQPHSHKANDSSTSDLSRVKCAVRTLTVLAEDERSIANKLAREEKVDCMLLLE